MFRPSSHLDELLKVGLFRSNGHMNDVLSVVQILSPLLIIVAVSLVGGKRNSAKLVSNLSNNLKM